MHEPGTVKTYGNTRISVLTPQLIRVEYSPDGRFCNAATQGVLNRVLQEEVPCGISGPVTSADGKSEEVFVKTKCAEFTVCVSDSREGQQSRAGQVMSVTLADGRTVTDFHKGNLLGTARTLDNCNGKTKLGEGVVSRSGCAVLNDSRSCIMEDDVHFSKRPPGTQDLYYFAYGNDYASAVKDYCRLTGESPLIPRFVLGNWWSRYHAYSQDEYLHLMKTFQEKQIPITVATVDMDWHWVHLTRQFGRAAAKKPYKPDSLLTFASRAVLPSGWTGYSWNTDLFPDHKAFLQELHDMGLAVTLNVHPADGVRFFETAYKEFADFMGVMGDEPIRFDLADPKFREGYFKFLHHPMEEEGVDFWWLDWQQGKRPNADGLDNLWALNHYHSLDFRERGKRPLVLSRFAGTGSQRYPLGFSGDTVISWKSLEFQPYFTATASNIGFPWWSHDIGGHMYGKRDDELYLRWVQFGTFSPILRLHSSNNAFTGKEPWNYSHEAEEAATRALQRRHRLIPYLYSMNYRTHTLHEPLVRPMYWLYPEEDEAYRVPNQYAFGTELLCAPITRPMVKRLGKAWSDVWLPEGRYTDLFTGQIYIIPAGGQRLKLFRDTASIPVLAREGSILPLSNDSHTPDGRCNNRNNPRSLDIRLYRGNGTFTLYEDDGETMMYRDGACAETVFRLHEQTSSDGTGTTLVFEMDPVRGYTAVVPNERSIRLIFADVADAERLFVTRNGEEAGWLADRTPDGVTVFLDHVQPNEEVKVALTDITPRENPPERELLTKLFSEYRGSNNGKQLILSRALEPDFDLRLLPDPLLRDAVREIRAMRK